MWHKNVHFKKLLRQRPKQLTKQCRGTSSSMSLENKIHIFAPPCIIIHQTHYEKSDWSRAFNQFTIACELNMINAISAADIAFIMSSSTSAWLPSPLEGSQKQNGWTLRFCFWGWIMDFSILMYTLFRQRFYYCILKFLNDLG